MEQEESVKQLVDKTIANHKTMIAAQKRMQSPPPFQTDLDRQHDYTEGSMNRCRRCGDSVVPVLPTQEMSLICSGCEDEMRERDAPMWFVEVCSRAAGRYKNVTKAVDTLPDEDKMIFDKEIEDGKMKGNK